MATPESAFEKVKGLVSDFKANELYYLSSKYSESEVREDYINKFFEVLGWDVRHKIQKNPYEQEVKVEKGVKVGRAQKRADYAFHLGPNFRDPVFFVEAKKPARSLSDPDDYFQAIRYGWNANTPIVILTDFEEFHIIDSRFKPDIDTALNKKLQYFHYSEYADKENFAEIYYLLSRQAVGNNSIEKYSESLPKPKGKAVQRQLFPGGFQSIDESFLKEIDEIRITLARAYKKSNPTLQGYELTEAIQRTIDRLVFIRFLEDKLIEQEHYISMFGETSDAWDDFVALSKRLDAKYNGIVFKNHFIDAPDFNKPTDVFGNICQDLSHLNSPYDFDKIPIHILGSIYERFLGKVVNATPKRVTIEEKPEVKKAGGVYYTPRYIVRYIVANTVGELIKGKTPLQISRIRFADIACGSGSFLIAVFETLLDYHNNWYQNNPVKAKSDGCFHQDGKWILSLQQKKNILLNNIYGVDIDSQAVEVTQLSLCLKLMEDETTATTNEMQVLFHEQILPDLTKNIVCGNSLIGWDIEDGILFPDEEMRKLNPMDFENAFPAIMNNGGFDAIVGNPPYVFTRDVEWGEEVKNYYWTKFNITKSKGTQSKKNQSGKINLYILFLLRASQLINKNGVISYIVPNGILRTTTYDTARKFLIEKTSINEIVDLKKGVFKGVTASTVIITFGKFRKDNKIRIIDANYLEDKFINTNKVNYIPQSRIKTNVSFTINLYVNDKEYILFEKIKKSKKFLKDITIEIIEGIVAHKKYIGNTPFNNKGNRKFLEGKDIKKYQILFNSKYILFDREKLHRARPDYVWSAPKKIIIQRISGGKKPLVSVVDFENYYSFASTNLILINKSFENIYSYEFISALLNSNLINFYYSKNFTNQSSLTVNISKTFLEMIPLPQENKEIFNKIGLLVKQIMQTKKKLATVKMDRDINYYERKCNNIDREINNAVYKLYGLSKDEIEIINSE